MAPAEGDDALFDAQQWISDDVAKKLPDGYRLRPLRQGDFDRGYLACLAQLTTVGDISRDTFNGNSSQFTEIIIVKSDSRICKSTRKCILCVSLKRKRQGASWHPAPLSLSKSLSASAARYSHFLIVYARLDTLKISWCTTVSAAKTLADCTIDLFHQCQCSLNSIIDQLTHIGKLAGCYKIILCCDEKNVGFYQKCGYAKKEVEMALYF
jgi:glucosamine-phosphate N-acetyltransferase